MRWHDGLALARRSCFGLCAGSITEPSLDACALGTREALSPLGDGAFALIFLVSSGRLAVHENAGSEVLAVGIRTVP